MDFGSLLRSVGNFFGIGKEEEDKKKNTVQQTPKAVSTSLSVPTTNTTSSPTVSTSLALPTVAPAPKTTQKAEDRTTLNDMISSGAKAVGSELQQLGGQATDLLLQGGGLVGQLGAITNPFTTEEEKAANLQRATAGSEYLRNKLQSNKDIAGREIVGNTDIEGAAGRIYTGTGTGEDFSRVAGRGLDIANLLTSAIPISTGANLAAKSGSLGLKSLAPVLAETGVIGTTGIAADVLSGRGISPASIALNYGLPLAAGAAGVAGTRALQNTRSARLAIANTADTLATRAATATDKELGSLGSGISSSVTAQAEREALTTAADAARRQADQLAQTEAQLTRVADQTVPQQRYTTPALQTVDNQVPTTLQRVEDVTQPQVAQTVNEAVPTPQVAENAVPTEAIAPTQVDQTPAPTPETLQAATPDGTPIRAQRLETEAQAQARQAAEQAAPVAPDNVPAPVSDAEARMAAQRTADTGYSGDIKELVDSGRVSGNVANEPVSTLKIGSDSTQFSELDKARVNEYKAMIQNGDTIDPVIVSRQGGETFVQDGAHRLQAYKELGYDTVPTMEQIPKADPRNVNADADTKQIVSSAAEKLSGEGSSYGKVVRKLYRPEGDPDRKSVV